MIRGDKMTCAGKKKKKFFSDNKGTTMMETVLAFTVLMIIIGILSQIVFYSSKLRMKAADEAEVNDIFNKEIYSQDGNYNKVNKKPWRVDGLEPGKGPYLYLTLNKEDTNSLNYQNIPEEYRNRRIQLSSIEMDCFSFDPEDSMITDNGITVPKAVTFVHKNDR